MELYLYTSYTRLWCGQGQRASYLKLISEAGGSKAPRFLGLRGRIPLDAWMSVCCECCVLSGRGLCDELITRPEETYRVWCVQ
jgi:hypothetical protein